MLFKPRQAVMCLTLSVFSRALLACLPTMHYYSWIIPLPRISIIRQHRHKLTPTIYYSIISHSGNLLLICVNPHASLFVPACLSAHVTRANANTGGPVSVCPMQTFCECVPGSSQLKHRWSDSESAREAPAKVRPRPHNQTTHSYEPFFPPPTSLVAFFSPQYPDGSAEAYCILNVTFCSRAAVEARPQLSCVRGN